MIESLKAAMSVYWAAPELSANIIVFFNIFGALLCGLVVGYERAYRGRAAGMRTYGMVCMAACALVVIDGYPQLWFGGQDRLMQVDPGRIIQGIMTGLGFLGAGVIMRDGMNISGLTTAASIWTTAAIGVLVGVGFYGAAILLTLVSAVFMMWGGKIEGVLPSRQAISMSICFRDKVTLSEEALRELMLDLGYEIAKGSFSVSEYSGKPEWKFVGLSVRSREKTSLVEVGRALSAIQEIETYTLSHARN